MIVFVGVVKQQARVFIIVKFANDRSALCLVSSLLFSPSLSVLSSAHLRSLQLIVAGLERLERRLCIRLWLCRSRRCRRHLSAVF